MNMKKGFTLIELLAVIIILGILMIIAVPNILSTLSTAKQEAFLTQAQSIYKAAEQQYTILTMQNKNITCFSNNPSYQNENNDDHKLDLSSVSGTVSYRIELSSSRGRITYIRVTDTGQGFSVTRGSMNSDSAVLQNSLTYSNSSSMDVNQRTDNVCQCGAVCSE